MYATYIEENFCYVLLIVVWRSFYALKWDYFSLTCFLWRKFDAAMSKLSFRARALDANKSLPVFHEEDVPDLPDVASVNRVVPQMPTGMEKEEETEHHLQRAISAQQIYGGSQRLIIPTPDAIPCESDYKQLKRRNVNMPKQLIHVQAFTLEDELPDYDCDENDTKWLEMYNKKNPDSTLNILEMERIIDTLEKSCSSRIDLFTVSDAQSLLKKNEKVVKVFFDYWKDKRTKSGTNLSPIVRTEKKDGTAHHDPYVAFRRRIEKMQTRKNRKNDESSYEKMLKLRRDLNRACLILEMVKQREERKRDLLQTTLKILESRYNNKDFSGELLHQCYDLLKHRQIQQEQKPVPLSTNNGNVGDQPRKRSEIAEEQRKRQKLFKQQQRTALMSASDDTHGSEHSSNLHSHGRSDADSKTNDGPDGKFTFRRKKGVIYHAPRYDSVGNWPWAHPVEGGLSSPQFSYARTSIQNKCRCIGFARRRVGRGGRINFDRAYAPFDNCTDDNNSSDSKGEKESTIEPLWVRVPPWPHFKPQHDTSCSDEEFENIDNFETDSHSKWLSKDVNATSSDSSSNSNHVFSKPSLYRSFSTQPTSRFRIHPYPSRTNNQTRKNSSINNQAFIASIAASFSKNVESQHWILRRSRNNRQIYSNSSTNAFKNHGKNISLTQQHTLSPPRPASTAPASAIYQLNFPISVATTTPAIAPSKYNLLTASLSTINNNNTILRTANLKSTNTAVNSATSSGLTTIDTSLTRVQLTTSIQATLSRQPLSIVQQPSMIAAQKIIPLPHVTVSSAQSSLLQVQPVVNNVRASKLTIPKGLNINHATVVSNGITQPHSMQLAR